MARSIAPLELNYLQNAGPSAVVDPVKRKSLADIVCQRVLSFTRSVRFGEEAKATSLRSWQIVIGARCNSCWKMESRRLLFLRSVAAQIAVKTTRNFLATEDQIDKVIFVLWGEDIYDAYLGLL